MCSFWTLRRVLSTVDLFLPFLRIGLLAGICLTLEDSSALIPIGLSVFALNLCKGVIFERSDKVGYPCAFSGILLLVEERSFLRGYKKVLDSKLFGVTLGCSSFFLCYSIWLIFLGLESHPMSFNLVSLLKNSVSRCSSNSSIILSYFTHL